MDLAIDVVVGIIKNETRFLIAKRPPQALMPGYWEFPGGKVEPEESQEKALARELDEELGIQVQRAFFLKSFEALYPNRRILLHTWEVLSYEGVPYGKENQHLAWAEAKDFSNFEFLPSNKALLDFLIGI